MKTSRIRNLPFVVSAMVLVGATLAWALERAPLNPEFVQYQEQLQTKTLSLRTAQGHSLGHIPAPTKLPKSTLAAARTKLQAPSSYDLRDHGKVSPVEDQGSYGNCWTFATFGSMESCLLPGESWNFSENNLANLHGLDSAYGEGGQHFMSLAYLGRWSGPVLESADPYSNGPNGSPTGLPVQKHVQSAWFVTDRTSSTDNETIKSIIMTYGGFYSAYYHDDNYYNSANYAYYYGGTNYANHAITIIGWDDTFSRTKFNTAPPGDGAFLIKNSWGAAWGNAGYFWISYYDYRIGHENCLFLNAESTANYESVYQYDTLGYCTSFGYGSTTAYGANIFSGASGSIKAVSFYAMADGAGYEVKVYTGVTAGSPTSGTLSATKSGTVTYAGYYTVVLDSPVSYSTRFAVVVKFTTPGSTYPIPVEYRIAGYSSAATASAGESYISSDGSSWEEAKDGSTYFNICIKAFGTGGGEGPTPPVSTGTPLLGDYDGDGYGDPVFYRSSSVWNLLFSAWGYAYSSFQFGGSGYNAMPGDFDGDGVQDPAVYETATGYWYLLASRYGYQLLYIPQAWGVSGCATLAGDYDGDRCVDPMVYQESSGYWYILSSYYGYQAYYNPWWGGSGFSPVTGDFDGDGYTDLMAYHRASGNWFILLSSTGDEQYYPIYGFGGSGYTPLVGDFDGDGYADLVAYHAASFTWYILLSSYWWTNGIYFTWDGSAP